MNIIKFDIIESTNDYLKSNYNSLDNFDVCVAKFQSKGKGRQTHSWESKPGLNLLFSILIKDEKIFKYTSDLTLLIGTSIFKYLTSLNIKNISIKWPNDIYVNDKKICGILCESKCIGESLKAIIIGIGLNVNQMDFKGFNGTSIKRELNVYSDLDSILETLLFIIKSDLEKLVNNKSDYLNIVNKYNYLYNKIGYINKDGIKEVATILDVNDDNSINTKLKDGTIYRVNHDEIILKK